MLDRVKDFVAHEFIIRDAKMSDINDIYTLGAQLNTVNLPADKAELEQVIWSSGQSFSLQEHNPNKRSFLFVLVNSADQVIGTSQIFAKHGSLDSPHSFFELNYDERYSETLHKHFRHRTLHLRQNFDGPTEIGSLVLDKKYRSMPSRLGRNLSFVRFLFMAMNPDFFSKRILAELLPPLGPNFESALWEAIGRKFTGLNYYEADMLSRKNKEFIRTLFPANEIYLSLLPDSAQEVIGQIGINSRAAAHLLAKIGFRYSQRVDPFDGGPHFEADWADISLMKQALHGTAICSTGQIPHHGDEALRVGLVGRFCPSNQSGQRFRTTLAAYYYLASAQKIFLHEQSMAVLGLSQGDQLSVIDTTHKPD